MSVYWCAIEALYKGQGIYAIAEIQVLNVTSWWGSNGFHCSVIHIISVIKMC